MNKKKILTISDIPIAPSGVGNQARYIIENLLKTGKYQFRSIGAALKHENYNLIKFQEYDNDWLILPVDGYGNPDLIRGILNEEKYDAIWFITDPRFYNWLVGMSDELQQKGIPLLYWHVWDNTPTPTYNKSFYQSIDYIGCISKLTHDIVKDLGFEKNSSYIPHAVDAEVFKPFTKEEQNALRASLLPGKEDRFVVFYNSRNARRKMTADIIAAFKQFVDIVGKDKAFMLMHTDPNDHEGPNLVAVCDMLGLTNNEIQFSVQKKQPVEIAALYNLADTTINISSNEGFGLSCLESLSCGTPVIITKTGGLQDQALTDTGKELGVVLEPAVRSLVGSQETPFIYDDKVSHKQILDAYLKMYNMTETERLALGQEGRAWTQKAFRMDDMINAWDKVFDEYTGKTETIKNANRIKLTKV